MLAGAGPSDKPVVDPAAADRGRKVWASECIDCHGTQARGGDKGPNLVRSVIVLRDRYGSQIGPFLKLFPVIAEKRNCSNQKESVSKVSPMRSRNRFWNF